MEKDRNGFTLIELMATIAILAIVTMIAVPTLTGIKNRAVKNALTSKINIIESAAKEYGNDNLVSIPSTYEHNLDQCRNNYNDSSLTASCKKDCLIVVVRTLIEQGYIIGDDATKTNLTNPVTNESLNNELVCIRFDSTNAMQRKMVAYVIGKNKWFVE